MKIIQIGIDHTAVLRKLMKLQDEKRKEVRKMGNKFEIGNDVKITETGVVGTIEGIWISRAPTQYQVYYFNTTKALQSDWFYAEDLELA